MYQISNFYELYIPTPQEETRIVFGGTQQALEDDDFCGLLMPESTYTVPIKGGGSDLAQSDGAMSGNGWLGARSWHLELMLIDNDPAERARVFDRIGLVYYGLRNDMTLLWTDDNIDKMARGVRTVASPQITHQSGPAKKVTLQLESAYPFIESQALDQYEVSGDGSVTVANAGSAPASPHLYLFGPFSACVVTNENTGEAFRIVEDIADGEWISVDTRQIAVLKNSLTSVYGSVDYNQNRFFKIDAESFAEVSFQFEDSDVNTLGRVNLRSAWW